MDEENITTKAVETTVAELIGTGGREITVREGRDLELHEPQAVRLTGTIDAPARWLEQRSMQIYDKTAYVTVDRDNLKITLVYDERDYYRTEITGCLVLSEEFGRFGINGGKYITTMDMAALVKMNRSFFETRQTAMDLVAELQNFRARVNKEIEHSENNRGDRRLLVGQVVDHNLPDAFVLTLPIFKGTSEQRVEVEVYVNPDDLSCTLVSAEANDIIESSRNAIIDDVIDRIAKACPGIVIIEQ